MSKTFSLLFAGLLFIGLAGEVEGEGIERAFTPTKSLDEIHGVVTAPDGVEFSFVVRDGQWLRLEDLESGNTVAYLPKIVDAKVGTVRVEEYFIEKAGSGERVSLTENSSHLRMGEAQVIGGEGYQVQLNDLILLGKQDDNDPSLGAFERAYGTQSTCCVQCNGTRVCGCSVSSSCGSCCSGSCCSGGGDGTIQVQHRSSWINGTHGLENDSVP